MRKVLENLEKKFPRDEKAFVKVATITREEFEAIQGVLGPILELTSDEGGFVSLYHDNPEFSGPLVGVGVIGTWTNDIELNFWGDSWVECLGAALAAKRDHEG